MIKKILSLMFAVLIVTSCSKDWNIAGSGLGNSDPAPSGSSGQVIEDNTSFDTKDDSSQGNTQGPVQSPSDSYDPNAAPPKITDPVMGSAWREFTNAPIQNEPGERSFDAYLAVLLQFNVQSSYKCRYTPTCGGTSDTRCNIYASDVMNAMGAPLPTKGDLGIGHGDAKNTDPMPANATDTYSWLEQQKDGWKKLDPSNPTDWATLMEHLASGKPAVVSHPDHIAVLRPDQPPGMPVGATGNLHIAQAGAYNSNDTQVKSAFGNRSVGIYVHE